MKHPARPLALVFFALAGCAGSETPEIRPIDRDAADDTSMDVFVPDDVIEADVPEPEPDTPVPDVPTPVDTTPDVDSANDVPDTDETTLCDVVGSECTPSTVVCGDGGERIFCDRCGFILQQVACGATERCDDSAGSAICAPCEGDECPDLNECLPNSRTCRDFRTSQVCGADGRVSATNPCPDGRRCFDGNCGPEGGATGATCTTNIGAGGCRGTLCVCGPEWAASEGTAGCTGVLDNGYCSTSGCVRNGCDPSREVCADFSLNGRFGGEDFCINRDGCTSVGATCGGAGLVCQELPTRGSPGQRIQWQLGCWASGSRAIGQTCTSNNDCAGGLCLTRSSGGQPVSYCSQRCGPDAGCPSNASCVEDPSGQPGFLCLANARSADCPRLDTEPLFIRATREIRRYEGGTARVCYYGF